MKHAFVFESGFSGGDGTKKMSSVRIPLNGWLTDTSYCVEEADGDGTKKIPLVRVPPKGWWTNTKYCVEEGGGTKKMPLV